jgi:hypothetical protein
MSGEHPTIDDQINTIRRELGEIQKQAALVPNTEEGRAEAMRLGRQVRDRALRMIELVPDEKETWLQAVAECDRELARMSQLESFWQEVEAWIAPEGTFQQEGMEGPDPQALIARSRELLEQYGHLLPEEVKAPIEEVLAQIVDSKGVS